MVPFINHMLVPSLDKWGELGKAVVNYALKISQNTVLWQRESDVDTNSRFSRLDYSIELIQYNFSNAGIKLNLFQFLCWPHCVEMFPCYSIHSPNITLVLQRKKIHPYDKTANKKPKQQNILVLRTFFKKRNAQNIYSFASQTEIKPYNDDCRAKVEFVATVLIDTFIWEQAVFIAEKIIDMYFILKTMQRSSIILCMPGCLPSAYKQF